MGVTDLGAHRGQTDGARAPPPTRASIQLRWGKEGGGVLRFGSEGRSSSSAARGAHLPQRRRSLFPLLPLDVSRTGAQAPTSPPGRSSSDLAASSSSPCLTASASASSLLAHRSAPPNLPIEIRPEERQAGCGGETAPRARLLARPA
ncbi:hypothetical protein E2562_025181 [Oryza meyeriana var. granulata]|uniref:Uncharacterized protein n=1 Tax=Oryza meyeriana var. granulata TaxID=110450 RepID=A0A6G1E208_9ORYZ|nr:hypothetical protein E2562_025181 [Oryza meyeriana var. granulata]